MLNKTIAPGDSCVINSSPRDENGSVVDPPSDVTWAQDGGLGTLVLLGDFHERASFLSTGPVGVATITMACQGKQAQVTVTVEAPVVLPFDHFSPFFE